uniref:Hyaluronidase n=1 Tax=Superstitionia donensis TaxID=311983 RepID=A0A1V1WBH0_9SCOR
MLLILIISMFSLSALGVDFNVYWHVPSSPCSERFNINVTHKLLKCNVLVNSGEKFRGDKIVWFYEYTFGRFPYMDDVNSYMDGGIPQLGNLTSHLEWAERHVEEIIPNPNFDGIAVIDWREWRPIYDYNWEVYQNVTKELVRKNNPSIREEEIESTARIQWEEAAKKWLLETLKLVKRMRPKAKWCYYSFPDCYNHQRGDVPHDFTCRKEIQRHNDRIPSWI